MRIASSDGAGTLLPNTKTVKSKKHVLTLALPPVQIDASQDETTRPFAVAPSDKLQRLRAWRDSVQQEVRQTPAKERRLSWYRLQLAALANAEAEVKALESSLSGKGGAR